MKKLLFVGIISGFIVGSSSCDNLDFYNNTKVAAKGIIVDSNGDPIANYPLNFMTALDDYANIDYYNSSYTYFQFSLLNTATTDDSGKFLVFMPDTSWREFMTSASGDSLKFQNNAAEITADYKLLNFENNTADVGIITIIE